MSFSKHFLDKTVALARLLFAFGLVERVTHHEDGVTPESDTTHTVMLGIMACAFAREHAPELDSGKIAEYALIHDLVEVYAGDTNVFAVDGISHEDKHAREQQAFARIEEEFKDTYPWLGETIAEYESLATPEARYVKVFDKILPKISHIINGGGTVWEMGHSTATLNHFLTTQLAKIEDSYGKESGAVMHLYRTFNDEFKLFMSKHGL